MMKNLKAAIATFLVSIKSFECIVICVLLAIDVVLKCYFIVPS